MKKPTLADFELTEKLIDDARKAHDTEENVFSKLCLGWVVLWLALGLLWGSQHVSKHFGMIQWGALGLLIGIFSGWIWAGIVLPFLMPRVFHYHGFYTPPFSRHYKFTQACEEYEDFLEQKRVILWQEEEGRNKQKEEYWFQMDGHAFEHEFADLLSAIGWRAEVTPGSNDKGIDIYAEHEGKRIGIQCKAHKNPVGPATVRELYGSAVAAMCDSSILVALGGVTSGARSFAQEQAIEVWTVKDVVRLHQESQNGK